MVGLSNFSSMGKFRREVHFRKTYKSGGKKSASLDSSYSFVVNSAL